MDKPNPIQIQKFLKGMEYPAKKKDLIKHAEENKADQKVMEVLQAMAEEEFQTPADVSKAVGQVD